MRKSTYLLFVLMLLLAFTGCCTKLYESSPDVLNHVLYLVDNQEIDEAMSILQSEIKKGSMEAKYLYARIHLNGYVENPDYELGYKFLQEALEAGNPRALNTMGVFYSQGKEELGIEQDYDKAFEYFQKAFDKGLAIAMYNAALQYEKLGDTETCMKCLEIAGDNGIIESYCFVASYNKEIGNYSKALEVYKKAIDKGDASSLNNLGDMYENGLGVEQDIQKAMELYQAAIDHGEPMGYLSLGYVYHMGHGVEKDLEKAKDYYQKALDSNVPEAQMLFDELLQEINQQ